MSAHPHWGRSSDRCLEPIRRGAGTSRRSQHWSLTGRLQCSPGIQRLGRQLSFRPYSPVLLSHFRCFLIRVYFHAGVRGRKALREAVDKERTLLGFDALVRVQLQYPFNEVHQQALIIVLPACFPLH